MRLGLLLFLAVTARGFLLNQPASSASCKPLAEKVGPVSPRSPRTAAAASDFEMAALAASAPRRLGKILPPTTVFFVCDVQERFRDLIFNMPAVISTTRYTLQLLCSVLLGSCFTRLWARVREERRSRNVSPQHPGRWFAWDGVCTCIHSLSHPPG